MLEFHVLIEKENDLYNALCLELDIASTGNSSKKAIKNLKEAVDLYIEDVKAYGEEDEFLPRPAPVEEWLKYFKVMRLS
ncbi:hypothetical protein GMMP15_910024 [Candidatus Magnetomoraceae bacterium gMMP-15]